MEEPEFWLLLEFRICDEFEGFEDNQLRWYWCDGLQPDRYDRQGGDWHITGRAWILTQNKPSRRSLAQSRKRGRRRRDSGPGTWTFTLIARNAGDRDAIDWEGLLPSDRLTGWLTPDPSSKTLKIDPASGYND